jgi:tetratricopeptide (TPR) repeat protein
MRPSEPSSLATKYLVDDLPGARQIGTRLYGILAKLDANAPVSELARAYLLTNNLRCLHALVEGQTDFETFKREAASERARRIDLAEIAAIEAASEDARLKAERAAASAAIFADPLYRRRQEAKQLKRRFNLGFIEPDHYPRAMRLLQALAVRERLKPEDVLWLQTEAEDCWNDDVAATWHLIEAEVLTGAWRTVSNPWDAINASSHWRKGGQPDAAISLTEEALAAKEASGPKVRSALATTRGAALRAMGRHAEAKAVGEQAQRLDPNDYRPCTLLGAVHMELGDLVAGHDWFRKAEERGASNATVDQDIRKLLSRTPEADRDRIRDFLLEQDPERFAWLKSKRDPAHMTGFNNREKR